MSEKAPESRPPSTETIVEGVPCSHWDVSTQATDDRRAAARWAWRCVQDLARVFCHECCDPYMCTRGRKNTQSGADDPELTDKIPESASWTEVQEELHKAMAYLPDCAPDPETCAACAVVKALAQFPTLAELSPTPPVTTVELNAVDVDPEVGGPAHVGYAREESVPCSIRRTLLTSHEHAVEERLRETALLNIDLDALPPMPPGTLTRISPLLAAGQNVLKCINHVAESEEALAGEAPKDVADYLPELSIAVVAAKALRELSRIRYYYPGVIEEAEAEDMYSGLADTLDRAMEQLPFEGAGEYYSVPAFGEPKPIEEELYTPMGLLICHPDLELDEDERATAASMNQAYDKCFEAVPESLRQTAERLALATLWDCRIPQPPGDKTFQEPQRFLQMLRHYWNVCSRLLLAHMDTHVGFVPHPLSAIILNLRHRIAVCFEHLGGREGVEEGEAAAIELLNALEIGDLDEITAVPEWTTSRMQTVEAFIERTRLTLGSKTYSLTWAEKEWLQYADSEVTRLRQRLERAWKTALKNAQRQGAHSSPVTESDKSSQAPASVSCADKTDEDDTNSEPTNNREVSSGIQSLDQRYKEMEFEFRELTPRQKQAIGKGVLSLTLSEAHDLVETWDLLVSDHGPDKPFLLDANDESAKQWLEQGRPARGPYPSTILERITPEVELLGEALGVDPVPMFRYVSNLVLGSSNWQDLAQAAYDALNRLYRRLSLWDEKAKYYRLGEGCTLGELLAREKAAHGSGHTTEQSKNSCKPKRTSDELKACPDSAQQMAHDDTMFLLKSEEQLAQVIAAGDLPGVLRIVAQDLQYWGGSLQWRIQAHAVRDLELCGGGFVSHWLARPIAGAQQAYEMLEFQRGEEYASSFKQRFDALDEERRRFIDGLLKFAGHGHGEGVIFLEDHWKDLYHMCGQLAQYVGLLRSQILRASAADVPKTCAGDYSVKQPVGSASPRDNDQANASPDSEEAQEDSRQSLEAMYERHPLDYPEMSEYAQMTPLDLAGVIEKWERIVELMAQALAEDDAEQLSVLMEKHDFPRLRNLVRIAMESRDISSKPITEVAEVFESAVSGFDTSIESGWLSAELGAVERLKAKLAAETSSEPTRHSEQAAARQKPKIAQELIDGMKAFLVEHPGETFTRNELNKRMREAGHTTKNYPAPDVSNAKTYLRDEEGLNLVGRSYNYEPE